MTPPRVALVMVAVTDLSASGGAERQFTDVFEYFRRTSPGRVTLVTARAAVEHLQRARRVSREDGIVTLSLGAAPARGLLNIIWMTALLVFKTVGRGFDVVHLCLPTPSYVPYAALVSHIPRFMRPRVVLNVIDCTLAHNLISRQAADLYERQVVSAHWLYLRFTRLDGIYTWYQAFAELVRQRHLVASSTVVRAAKFCFTDPQRFAPSAQKENVVVFAGRFSTQKRPTLFVDAVGALRQRCPELIDGWQFRMYGNGELSSRIRERISERGLDDVLSVSSTPDMAPVFARTRLFVSTQALENFTSLAMLEAMAAGNAIIAEDVGQTRDFIVDGQNGLLVSVATAEHFADAIEAYLRHPEWHARMADASRERATRVHTIEHFADDITAFWRQVAS